MDTQDMSRESTEGFKYMLLVVDRASRFPFACPLKTKEASGVAKFLMEICLSFGVPVSVRFDGGAEFTATLVQDLCRWLRADISYGPVDHPRAQGTAERLGAWFHDVLSELCHTWPERWSEYVQAACWIKRTLPDPSLPKAMSPFQLLFGRSPRTPLETVTPLADGDDGVMGLDSFVEQRRRVFREIRDVLEKRHAAKAAARAKGNAAISRPSAGGTVNEGSLVMVREADSTLHREDRNPKLVHEKWTGPWRVTEIIQAGLSMVVKMQGRKERERRVSAASVKPFYVRPRHLRHRLEDEFAQQAWRADLGHPAKATANAPLYTLVDRRKVTSTAGTERWEYRGKYPDGSVSEWLSENETRKSFTALQLDTFHALANLYAPSESSAESARTRPPRCKGPEQEPLRLFPIGTRIVRTFLVKGETKAMTGEVFDYCSPYWRVKYVDGDWEELSLGEIRKFKEPQDGSS